MFTPWGPHPPIYVGALSHHLSHSCFWHPARCTADWRHVYSSPLRARRSRTASAAARRLTKTACRASLPSARSAMVGCASALLGPPRPDPPLSGLASLHHLSSPLVITDLHFMLPVLSLPPHSFTLLYPTLHPTCSRWCSVSGPRVVAGISRTDLGVTSWRRRCHPIR